MSPVVKRKGERFSIPSKYILIFLTVLCSGMMLMTFSTDLFNKPLNAFAGYVIVPFQRGISSVGGWFSTRAEELSQIRSLLSENEALKQQVAELTAENIQLQQEKYELNTLQALYEIDEQYAGYDKTGARIIARDSGNWYQSFTIDKGTKDGIKLNMNVMAGSGLVGIVTEVGYNWARVTSIIDDSSNVSGMTLATGDNMIVSGNLELMSQNKISFSKLIDSNDQVKEGDKVVTSNISDKYLPGLLIGYITSIESDSNNLTHSGTITPAVDYEHMDEVLVILDLKQQTESEE